MKQLLHLPSLTTLLLSSMLLIGCDGNDPPWKAICKTLGFDILTSPNSDLSPGWVIRSSDQQPFYTNCFTGDIHRANGFSSYNQSTTVSNQIALKANLGKYANAVTDFSNIQSITISATDLREDFIANIKPNLDNINCSVPSLTSMTNIKSLLSFQTISLKVETKNNVDVKTVVDGIQTKLGNIDGSVKFSRASDDAIDISGTSLYIGYKKFQGKINYAEVEQTINNATFTEFVSLLPNNQYSISYHPNDPEGMFEVSCSIPGLLTHNPTKFSLAKGKRQILNDSNQFGSSVILKTNDQNSATLVLQEWSYGVGGKNPTP